MSMLLAVRVWRLNLDKTTTLVLMALCDSANDDGTGCIASEDYICWKTNVSRAQFYRVRSALEAKGITERRSLADGRIETIIHLDKAPEKTPWQRPKRGRPVKSHGETPQHEKGSHGETKGSHGETVLSHGETDPLYMIHPSDPTYETASLAKSAETVPSELAAPPKRRTQEKVIKTAMERDPLFAALASELHTRPITRHEWGQWAKCINDLNEIEATPGQVAAAVRAFHRLYPQAQCTVFALLKNWGTLTVREGMYGATGTAPVKTAAQVDAEHAAARAEYERQSAQWAAFEAKLVADGIVGPPPRR